MSATPASCEAEGCCWARLALQKEVWQPSVFMPSCFYPNTGGSDYQLDDPSLLDEGLGNGTLMLVNSTQPELGPDVVLAGIEIEEAAPDIVHMRIWDVENPRFEVPPQFFAPGSLLAGDNATSTQLVGQMPRLFEVQVASAPFGVAVLRVDPSLPTLSKVTFNCTGERLVFKDQYIELTTKLAGADSSFLYGIGERASETVHMTRNGYPYSLWSSDTPPTVPMRNSYGHWPFVMVQEADGSAWGILLLNSNGMDVVPTVDKLSWRSTGGIINMYVFMGPRPLDVVEQLTRLVGRPAMQPYWALGFQAGRHGCPSVANLKDVVERYSANNISLEVIYSDVDYMDAYRTSTLDPVNYPAKEMQSFLEALRSRNQSWVPVVNPGVKIEPDFSAYLEGLRQDAFMKGPDGQDYIGWVWPGAANFPDLGWNPQADVYWEEQLSQLHTLAPWDGLWLSMNEISNFCNGEPMCDVPTPADMLTNQVEFPRTCQLTCSDPRASGLDTQQMLISSPPYKIANRLEAEPLHVKTVSVLVNHSGGVLDYNAHSLYGMLEARASYKAYQATKQRRPFLLTRSTYVGSGAYTAHWTGENNSTWTDMRWSIPGIINAGLAGIPMAGADVCGFLGNTTEQLCARWVELGAWYPLMRNHNSLESEPQELYLWNSVAESARIALALRYRMLSYFYTVLQAATETGAPIMRPLFLNFPSDPVTFNISRQFMIGDAILVSPVLYENETDTVQGYVPAGLWYSLWGSGSQYSVDTRNGGQQLRLQATVARTSALLRGGSTIIHQAVPETVNQVPISTSTVRHSVGRVLVALPQYVVNLTSAGNATFTKPTTDPIRSFGYIYQDDGGMSPDSVQANTSCCHFLQFNTTITYDTAADIHSGILELTFGKPGASSATNEVECRPNNGYPDVAYAGLWGVEIWGWRRGVVNASINIGGVATMLPPEAVSSDGYRTVFDMSSLPSGTLQFACPFTITSGTVTWQSSPPPPPLLFSRGGNVTASTLPQPVPPARPVRRR